MSEENQSLSIINTWVKALTSPSDETYQQIADDPGASFGKSALWIFLAGMLGSLISGMVNYVRFTVFGSTGMEFFGDYGEFFQGLSMFQPSIFGVITGSPVAGVMSVIFALVAVGLIYVVSRALGGVGSYEKLFTTMAAYEVPLGVVIAIVGAVPVVNCLSVVLGIYGIVLGVIANKVVMEYNWGKAFIASVAVPLAIAAVIFLCMFVIVGSAIEAVFQNIVDGLNAVP
jgi:hypothetical protein